MRQLVERNFCLASTQFTITDLKTQGCNGTITSDGLVNTTHDPREDWMSATRKIRCPRSECKVRKTFVVHGYGNEPYYKSGRLAVNYLRGHCPLWKEMTKHRWESRRLRSHLSSNTFFPK